MNTESRNPKLAEVDDELPKYTNPAYKLEDRPFYTLGTPEYNAMKNYLHNYLANNSHAYYCRKEHTIETKNTYAVHKEFYKIYRKMKSLGKIPTNCPYCKFLLEQTSIVILLSLCLN